MVAVPLPPPKKTIWLARRRRRRRRCGCVRVYTRKEEGADADVFVYVGRRIGHSPWPSLMRSESSSYTYVTVADHPIAVSSKLACCHWGPG